MNGPYILHSAVWDLIFQNIIPRSLAWHIDMAYTRHYTVSASIPNRPMIAIAIA
jgi:hypothetical protein